jgi:hypothetical protein
MTSSLSSLKKFFLVGFEEFRDPVLRYFGVSLAVTHLLSVAFYLQTAAVDLVGSAFPVCWPFLPNCYMGSPWSENFAYAFLAIYAVTAAASAYFYVSTRLWSAWTFSLLALILKLTLTLQDYRLMGNYHYMIYVIHFLFLFYPRKRAVIPAMVVAIYVAAGTLKFNFEWLSGSALLTEPLAKGWLLVAMCTYVVILEMIFSFGLLSRDLRVLRFSLLQFFIFHIFSYGQVGFFYPCVMFCLLSIFYLPLILRREGFRLPRSGRTGVALPICIFAVAQMMPLVFPGDSSLTGQGRIFALNMFDARTDCLIAEIARFDKATVETNPVFQYMRIRCDPISVVGLERSKCASYKSLPGFKDLDVYMNVKKHSGEARPVLRIENFCQKNIEFGIWRDNDYIL